MWAPPGSDGVALPAQVLSKTMDSTTLTTDKVELSTITRDEAAGGRVPPPPLPHARPSPRAHLYAHTHPRTRCSFPAPQPSRRSPWAPCCGAHCSTRNDCNDMCVSATTFTSMDDGWHIWGKRRHCVRSHACGVWCTAVLLQVAMLRSTHRQAQLCSLYVRLSTVHIVFKKVASDMISIFYALNGAC